MNENKKTGIFWVAAAAMMTVGTVVAWPTSTKDEDFVLPGSAMFEKFKDPLAAASLKVVTYDAEQAKLSPFEVRRDQTGNWTIPSRNGYPADAVEQMTNAANAFVGLKILDVQTEKAELHDELGVLEPKLEDLQGGEDGVGRLVTFKDESNKTLASLIIGYPVKDEEGKIYVRKPGEDPVYVVKLDDSPLTTKFQDWIEDDLLQLSSIEIKEMEIKDYTAALAGLGNEISWERRYSAKVSVDGTDWNIDEILEHEPGKASAPPVPVQLADDTEANKEKLDEIKNALDDLKIVDVLRKPEGMSASLKADDKLVSDQEAFQSLLLKGFFPVGDEVISANGEMTVSLEDGVRYLLRFGNVTGITEQDGESEEEEGAAGVNRYMLVTTDVDESQFPTPELQEVPESLEDLEALMAAANESADPADAISQEALMKEAEQPVADSKDGAKDNDDAKDTEKTDADEPSESSDDAETETDPEEAKTTGETEAGGEEDASVSGGGLTQESDDEEGDESESEAEGSDTTDSEASAADAVEMTEAESEEGDDEEATSYEDMTDDEKLELLEAEQEKITKANQRKLDARNEKIESARRRVRELNERFADWYYVIPENTYRQLRVERDELIQVPEAEDAADASTPMPGAPSFTVPPPGIAAPE